MLSKEDRLVEDIHYVIEIMVVKIRGKLSFETIKARGDDWDPRERRCLL